jgi:hypothetical protein
LANWLANASTNLLIMPIMDAAIANQLKVFLAHHLRIKQILPTCDISFDEICITRFVASDGLAKRVVPIKVSKMKSTQN